MTESEVVGAAVEQHDGAVGPGEDPMKVVGEIDQLGESGVKRVELLKWRVGIIGLARDGPRSVGVLVDQVHDAGHGDLVHGNHNASVTGSRHLACYYRARGVGCSDPTKGHHDDCSDLEG